MILFFVTTSNIDSMWISHILTPSCMYLHYFICPFVHAAFCVIPIGPDHRFEESHHELDVNFIYIGSKWCINRLSFLAKKYLCIVYLAEIVLKLIAFGPVHYFRSYWNK